MAIYVVDRHLPGITPEQLGGAQRAAIEASQRLTAQGKSVRYIRSMFVPDDERCLCLFEAASAERVSEANTAAGLPYRRIVEALDLTPVALLLLVLGSVVGVACGWNPVAPSSVAVPSGSAPVALGGVVTASGRPAASCSNINAIVAATLGPGGTATGTISGDINGAVSAAIHAIDASGGGRGALHVQMEHHYTNTTPFGRIDTSDQAVLAPMDKGDGTYRMNNRLTVVGGEGIYSGASGYIETHGSVDFVTGSISLTLKGRICS